MRRTSLLGPLVLLACGTEATDTDPALPNPPGVTVGAPDDPDPPGPVGPIQEFSLGEPAQGVARAPDGNLWFLVPSRGLVETTASGTRVSQIAWGERGLASWGITDLAVLDDGSFALTASQEVFRYRPGAASMESYFCFVPETEVVQENQAIAYAQPTGLIHVSPAFWDTTGSGEPFSIRLEVYTAADAAWQAGHDITPTGIIARGLAWDPDGDHLWVASGGELHHFTAEGALERSVAVDGVSDAQGVLVDGDQLVVLDGATGSVVVLDWP